MKSLPNSSPSSSSSTSYIFNNFENGFYNSKRCTSGCIRSVLRRFLCFNSLPTHPSDHLKESSNECDYESGTHEAEDLNSSATPGLVARLMGLDTMPMTDFGDSKTNFNPVRRCKSMDFEREKELKQRKGKHVKGTLSFRDVPGYIELENDEFFILSFEGDDDNKNLVSKTRKSKHISEKKAKRSENKRRQCVQENDKENQENVGLAGDKKLLSKMVNSTNSKEPNKVLGQINENSQCLDIVKKTNKPTYNKETPERGRLKKNKNKKNSSPIKKIETECDSENSSPVSVLDFADFPVQFEVHNSVQSSRRTLFEELENYKKSSSLSNNRLITSELEVKKSEDKSGIIFWKRGYQSENYAEMWGLIYKFAEKDMKQNKWMNVCKEILDHEEFEEITKDIGFQILDQLLVELVDQVSSLLHL